MEELVGVWVHEVSHLLRDHHGRSDRVARQRWLTGPGYRLRMNIAADCEINDDVLRSRRGCIPSAQLDTSFCIMENRPVRRKCPVSESRVS